MHKWAIELSGVLVVLLGAAGWLLFKRPLAFWGWVARQSLKGSKLRRLTVPSPSGPQVVFVGGAGPVLVLVHGAGHDAGTWSRVVPALVRHYTLVIPDLAGHGASAPASGPIEAADVVAGLEAVVAAQAQGGPVTLLGNSLGGWMAMVVARRHPEWVERVVAVNGGPLKDFGSSVNLLPRTREEARATMDQLRYAGSPKVPDYLLDDLVRPDRNGALARFAATAATMGAWNLTEEQLKTLDVPVQLLWGTSDGLMALDYARRMLAVLPKAQLFPIEQCGHVPQQEAPGRFLEALAKAMA
jgi:pimeloyl-ACP methyl ester carboxylesterase